MNIRELFERAYSDVYEKYPFSDTNTAMSGIMGKAEKMKKENITRINASELPAPEIREKRSRAPMIGGIAAGIAAALGVGFFAGSLNGGGIQFTPLKEGGAGYSANEELPESEDTQENAETEDTAETYEAVEKADAAETEELPAETDLPVTEEMSAPAEDNAQDDECKSFRFPDDNMLVIPDNYGSGHEARLLEMTVSNTQVMLRYRDDRLNPDNTELVEALTAAPVAFRLEDGRLIVTETVYTEFDGINHDQDLIVLASISEPISLSEITEVYVGITPVWGDRIDAVKWNMMDYKNNHWYATAPLYTEADEWYDFGEYRVHVTGYTFDGISLRLGYDLVLNEDCGFTSDDFTEVGSYVFPVTGFESSDGDIFMTGGSLGGFPDIVLDKYTLPTQWDWYCTEPMDEITVPIVGHELVRADNCGEVIASYTFTAKLRDDITLRKWQSGGALTDTAGNTYPVEYINLTEKEISAIISNIPYTDFRYEPAATVFRDLGEICVKLVLTDGREISSRLSLGMPISNGSAYLHYSIPEIIDPENVAEIWFNDNRIV